MIRPYGSYISCLILPDCYAEVSSTEVRKRLDQGESISQFSTRSCRRHFSFVILATVYPYIMGSQGEIELHRLNLFCQNKVLAFGQSRYDSGLFVGSP